MLRLTMARAILDDELIDRVRESVSSASTLDEAVERIATGLPSELEVSRVGFRMHDVDNDFVVVIGVWSKKPTQLKVGVSYPIASSLGESFTSIVRTRVCSMRVVGKDPIAPPVVQEILAAEGNASGVLIPVPRGIEIPAVLAIFSGRIDAFSPRDGLFFDRLGLELAAPLLSRSPLP
jgi:hypothetical protein